MPKKPETLFRARFQKKLDEIPGSWWESIQQKAIQGTPDILGCVGGAFVALELKATPTSKITALQQLKLGRIDEAGGIAWVVHPENAEDILTILRMVAGTNRGYV